MKDFLEYLAKNIVDNPDKVEVEEDNAAGYLTLTLSVDPTDMGKIIGREGRIIKALRELVKILAVKQNLRVNVLLKEDQPVSPSAE